MSRGSSPTNSVLVMRGTWPGVTSTTLTLSETRLTTQTSLLLRAATATGSRPTVTDDSGVRPCAVRRKISRRESGTFVTNSRVPSGDKASGRVGIVSKLMIVLGPGACTVPGPGEFTGHAVFRTASAKSVSGAKSVTGILGRIQTSLSCSIQAFEPRPTIDPWPDPRGESGH